MTKAIVTLTKGGADLGRRLLKLTQDTVLYTHPKFFLKEAGVFPIKGKFSEFVGSLFTQYEGLIFIMATGIVVRSIAPYIQDKKKDPAVIVLDEKGTNVISLLSGHIGGANEMTKRIAKALNANPVITTASDVNHSLAVDTLAMKLGWEIENFDGATKVTAHIVNKEKVGLIYDGDIAIDLPKNIVTMKDRNAIEECKGLIVVTDQMKINLNHSLDTVILRPKNMVIGIGCRKGKDKETILNAIDDTLTNLNISKKSIKHIATVDVKKDEAGIIQACDHLKVPLIIVDREKISLVEDQFEGSDFVKKHIGVQAVCEPVAYITSNHGVKIQKKKAYDGITLAVFREGE